MGWRSLVVGSYRGEHVWGWLTSSCLLPVPVGSLLIQNLYEGGQVLASSLASRRQSLAQWFKPEEMLES